VPRRCDQDTLSSRSLLSETKGRSALDKNVDNKLVCELCKKSQSIENCRLFLEMDLEGRKSFAKDKGLCFGCLSIGHISKYCKQKKKCKECQRFHPTCLHGDFKKRKDATEKSFKADQYKQPVTSHPVVHKESYSYSSFLS
jgi:hypothetical protein